MEEIQKFYEICKDQANRICFDYQFYLCDSCFKFIHEKNSNSLHKKEEINPFNPMEIKCPEHPKNQINLFCISEKSKNIFFNFNLHIYRTFMLTLLFFK